MDNSQNFEYLKPPQDVFNLVHSSYFPYFHIQIYK